MNQDGPKDIRDPHKYDYHPKSGNHAGHQEDHSHKDDQHQHKDSPSQCEKDSMSMKIKMKALLSDNDHYRRKLEEYERKLTFFEHPQVG